MLIYYYLLAGVLTTVFVVLKFEFSVTNKQDFVKNVIVFITSTLLYALLWIYWIARLIVSWLYDFTFGGETYLMSKMIRM